MRQERSLTCERMPYCSLASCPPRFISSISLSFIPCLVQYGEYWTRFISHNPEEFCWLSSFHPSHFLIRPPLPLFLFSSIPFKSSLAWVLPCPWGFIGPSWVENCQCYDLDFAKVHEFIVNHHLVSPPPFP